MEASQETIPEQAPEPTGPTAKEMAAAEEANLARQKKLIEQQQEDAQPKPFVPVADVAARGYDALHEAFRLHNERNQPKEYVPPPRTERQMSALQEELEAGRRAQQRAEAQQLASRPPKEDLRKEGFTTPVHRPDNMVPDPMTVGTGMAGLKPIGPTT
jgi:hypothetical protein